MEFDNKPWCIWTEEEKEINVWSSLALYFTLSGFLQSLGCTMDCMYNPSWICTIHTCAKWLQNMYESPSAHCMSPSQVLQDESSSHKNCAHHPWQIFFKTWHLLITVIFQKYPTVQNSTEESIQERWRCTGEHCQLCYSHISQFKLSDNSATAAKIFILRIKSHLWQGLLPLTIL